MTSGAVSLVKMLLRDCGGEGGGRGDVVWFGGVIGCVVGGVIGM